MAMSRRKQPHPKSLKEGDETSFVLPDELQCDEQTHEIVARLDLEQGHRFGPFPACLVSCQQRLSADSDSTDGGAGGGNSSTIVQINTSESAFQLLDNKHNWLVRCSTTNTSATNLEVQFHDNQLSAIVAELIPTGTRLTSSVSLLPKPMMADDSQLKQETKPPANSIADDVKIKAEPIESEEDQSSLSNTQSDTPISSSKVAEVKKHHPLMFTCDDCGIRFSNRSTLDAHRQHYCLKRGDARKSHSTDLTMPVKLKSMKRKHTETSDSASSPTKRLSVSSQDTYCSECDILFSKADNLLQHKLHYCRTKPTPSRQLSEQSTSGSSFRPPIPFDRPIQIGQFIYIPVPIVSSSLDKSDQAASPTSHESKPLDLSKPKKSHDTSDTSTSPLDLTVDKPTSLFNLLSSTAIARVANHVQQQVFECDYCSIRFSSLKTLHAHQENYCIEYRKQKKSSSNHASAMSASTNETGPAVHDSNRSQSPPISSLLISKAIAVSPNDSSHLPPHRSSPFMCRLCKYRGNTLRGMRMHFKFHLSNNEPCTDEDIIVTSSLTNSHSSLPPSQLLLKCKICSAMFDHEDALLNHIKCVHTKESLLECLDCQSRFCSRWNLLRHMKLTHTNIKCDDDDEHDESQLNESQYLLNESNNEHNADEDPDLSSSSSSPSSSNSSNEKSSDPVNLTRHVLLESMDTNSMKKLSDGLLLKKRFACPYCHIKFGSVDTLKQHMTNYCSSRPKSDGQLQSKKKSMDTYCSACQIPFRQKSSYDAHKMYYCRGSNKAHVKMQA